MIPPLFPFYGSKWRDAKRYPPPGAHCVEPFAGSAGYSLWHEPPHVTLIDADPIIVGVWDYLRSASARELLELPDVEHGESTLDLHVCQEARWLIGFWLNRGSAQPKLRATAYSTRTERSQLVWSQRARERLAAHVGRVRHWDVHLGTYDDAPRDERATYFVDPPYTRSGRYYRVHDVDHHAVGRWARKLPGDVIVCEQAGADWLPFETLANIKSTRGRSSEVVYLNNAARQGVLF